MLAEAPSIWTHLSAKKVLLGVLLGAIGGAVVTAGILRNPFTSSTANNHQDKVASEYIANNNPTYPQSRLRTEDSASQLERLRELLNLLQQPAQIGPALRTHLQDVLIVLAQTDPIGTAELIEDIKNNKQRHFMQRLFLRLWVESQGTDLLKSIPATWRDTRPLLHSSVFRALANSYPEATLPHILALSPADNRASLMINIVYRLDSEKMNLVFESLDQLTANERENFLDGEAFELASKAPHQLLAWSSTLNEKERQMAARAALNALARSDPKTAIALVDVHSTGDRRGILRLALRELAATEPKLAVAEAEERGGFFTEVARVWALSNPAAASQWLIQRTPEDRNSSHDPLMSIAGNWGRRDQDASLVFAQSLPESLRRNWISAMAASLEGRDPANLEILAETLSGTPYAAGIHSRLAARRYTEDPDASIRQVLSLKPEQRDQPLEMLINHYMDKQPEASIPLIEKITDQDSRMQTLGGVLRRWHDAEDGAMQHWLENEASPMLRDEAYAVLAANQPALLPSIGDEKLRVATYLRSQERSRSTIGLKRLLEKIGLSEAQWSTLNDEAIAAAK